MTKLRDASEMLPKFALDRKFYENLRSRAGTFVLKNKFVIPPFNGRGFIVSAGHAFRIVQVEGPQVADVTFWNANNPEEYFGMARTWQLDGFFIRPFSRLWSDLPYLRPMAVCLEDTVRDQQDGFHHHFCQSHCCAEVMEARLGAPNLNSCHANLLQAIEPFGLTEKHIHDNINVHQAVRVDPVTGKLYNKRTETVPGDYIEFFANIDLLVAVSVCPNGDGTQHQALENVKPIGIEIYDTGATPPEFVGWHDWRKDWTGAWKPTSS